MCIVSAEFTTPLIFTHSISSSEPRSKTVKGKKIKKGIAIFEDNRIRIADSAKMATEKHIEKLIKQKCIMSMSSLS